MADVYRAREPFAYTDKAGVPRVVTVGSLMSADDPNFKGKEHLFERVEVAAARSAGVEEATAEPGTRRSMPRPAMPKRAARKGPDPKPDPKPDPTPEPKVEPAAVAADKPEEKK